MEALANLTAALHIGYFIFVVGGSIAILAGMRRPIGPWIYNPWFRISHLAAVFVILAEDVFHFPCPLNVIENNLRSASAGAIASPSAPSGILDLLLRHTIPGWFLDAMYWVLGAVLLVLIFLVPPKFRRRIY
jgi:hypothetical protein